MRGLHFLSMRWVIAILLVIIVLAASNLSGVNGLVKRASRQLTKPQQVEMVFVVDSRNCRHYRNQTKDHVLKLVKIMNEIFAPQSIFISLAEVVEWTGQDKINISADAEQTLNNFLNYRKQYMPYNDHAQLLTAVEFRSGITGKSMVGTLCTYKFSGAVISDHHLIRPEVVATTMVHELAHSFGVAHDDHDVCSCTVANGHCIMSASASANQAKEWSSCSIEGFKKAMAREMDTCLGRPDKVGVPLCGNGVLEVELGEECDCGATCNTNNCCGADCRFTSGAATCSSGECCDLQRCTWKKAGSECRGKASDCDLPEYCTGNSTVCPSDVFAWNGKSCGQQAHCYDGKCGSKEAQCKKLWGQAGSNAEDICYDANNEGVAGRHCGYNMTTEVYRACPFQDTECGVLQCKATNTDLALGYKPAALLSTNVVNAGYAIYICRTVTVDFGLRDTDPGLVPDGASCGPTQMCAQQKCIAIEDPCKCNHEGVCNNKGHCHCPKFMGGPDCSERGLGGSLESGPASAPVKPKVSISTITSQFKLHSTNSLICRASGNPAPDVLWQNNGHNLASNYTYKTDTGTAILLFSRITDTDNGVYTCTALSEAGTDTQAYKVAVVQEPTILEDGITKKQVRKSTEVNLTCSATGIPPPNIEWTRPGKVIAVTATETVQHGSRIVTSTLDFHNIQSREAGLYTCKALNAAGMKEKRYEIIVTEPTPSQQSTITSRSKTGGNTSDVATAGTNTTLTCTLETDSLLQQQLARILLTIYMKLMQAASTGERSTCSSRLGAINSHLDVTKNLTAKQLGKLDEMLSEFNDGQLLTQTTQLRRDIATRRTQDVAKAVIDAFKVGRCDLESMADLRLEETETVVPVIVKGFLSLPQQQPVGIIRCLKTFPNSSTGVRSLIQQVNSDSLIYLAYLLKAEFPGRGRQFSEEFPASVRNLVWAGSKLCIRNKFGREYVYLSEYRRLEFTRSRVCPWRIEPSIPISAFYSLITANQSKTLRIDLVNDNLRLAYLDQGVWIDLCVERNCDCLIEVGESD